MEDRAVEYGQRWANSRNEWTPSIDKANTRFSPCRGVINIQRDY